MDQGRAFSPEENRRIGAIALRLTGARPFMISTADIAAVVVESAPHGRSKLVYIGHEGQHLAAIDLNYRFLLRMLTLAGEATYGGGMAKVRHVFELGKENDPA